MTSICRVAICCLAYGIADVAQAQPFDSAPEALTVMSWNVEWMFDHDTRDNRRDLPQKQSAPSQDYWENKLASVTQVIASEQPYVVALQEIESGRTLGAIRSRLKSEHDLSYRYVFIQGRDTATEQDVGLLYRGGLVSYSRFEQSGPMYRSGVYYNISKHLFAQFRWDGVARPFNLLNLHLRATAEREDLRVKQAKLARVWMQPALERGEDVLVLGDFNSEHPAGVVKGDIAELVGSDQPQRMVDLITQLADPQQATHLILPKQFDRMLASTSMQNDDDGLDWVFDSIKVLEEPIIRGQRDGEEHWDQRLELPASELDISDHFPLIATFRLK